MEWQTGRAMGWVLLALALSGRPAGAQDIDAMARWTSITVVHWRVVGEFNGPAVVLSPAGQLSRSAVVSDRIELELDWNQEELKLVGKPVIRNFPTKLGPFPAGQSGCLAPKVEGPFEHATVLAVTDIGAGGPLTLQVRREQPGGAVHVFDETIGPTSCNPNQPTWAAASPKTETVTLGLMLTSPMMLAMPGSPNVTPDGKSFIVDSGTAGWKWTLTPTPK